MSYCRWSSDDFQCDVYVYESEDGYVIHVASNRLFWLVPLPKPYTGYGDEFDFEDWYQRHRTVRDLMDSPDTHTIAPIGLPHDGETFIEDDAEEAAARLVELQKLGYQVPDYAIEELREEANERT